MSNNIDNSGALMLEFEAILLNPTSETRRKVIINANNFEDAERQAEMMQSEDEYTYSLVVVE